jgi:hypothetical protein
MGWEVELNAMPSECSLFESIRQKGIDAELLTFVPAYFRLRRQHNRRVNEFVRGDIGYKAFVDVLEQIVTSHPGIDHRFCSLDRRFDWLKWLLIQCAQDNDEKRLAEESISGESRISGEAKSVQGFPIRWTPQGKVKQIHGWLSELTLAAIRSKFDPEKMSRVDLYKWGPEEDSDATFDVIASDFEAVQMFYREVSSQSESVLVIID